MSREMVMFAKLSLMSFINELIETFYFPNETVKKNLWQIFDRKGIWTDAESSCLKFIFVSDPKRDVCEQKFRDIRFEVMIAKKSYNRVNSSHEYWEKFDSRKENLWTYLKVFPYFVTIAWNPKEYYEMFEDSVVNEKHRGIKTGSPGMDFENYISM